MQGIYIGYFAGTSGHSLGIFYLGSNTIAGADIGGIKYDGEFSSKGGQIEGRISYTIPPDVVMVTGFAAGDTPKRVEMPLHLPSEFHDGRTFTIETPIGRLNARFEKVREISP